MPIRVVAIGVKQKIWLKQTSQRIYIRLYSQLRLHLWLNLP